MKPLTESKDIAVIGMAGRFPGAKNIQEFWENIENKIESIISFDKKELFNSGIPKDLLDDSNYIKSKGFLKNASMFDAKFFNINAHDAKILDPQFRQFLETAWEALENAAYISDDNRYKIGVFAGASARNNYYTNNILKNKSVNLPTEAMSLFTANARDFLSTLVAYKLNLTGPCITMQTACSTSLVAICQACENLLADNCNIALAGGVSVTTPIKSGYFYQEGVILSRDGHCRPFDINASGTVAGNGAGILVLKKLNAALKDHDHIHAIIKGFSINNDGGHKLGFYAPSVQGQENVIKDALKRANLSINTIDYIEAHGTGTHKGDLIELAALSNVFGGLKQNSIALGSVKSNIGHLDAASGVVGCIKTIEALKHKTLPPMLHFSQFNSNAAVNMPFFINTESKPWKTKKGKIRSAGVSSFGIGGTNAHIIFQEAPTNLKKQKKKQLVLLILSATALSMLVRIRRNLANYLKGTPPVNLINVAYTLQTGRKAFPVRYACICDSINEAIQKLENVTDKTGLDYGLNYAHKKSKHLKNELLFDLAEQWLKKTNINWAQLYNSNDLPYRLPLPTYPFEKKEYWINPDLEPNKKTNSVLLMTADKVEKKLLDIFKEFLGSDEISSSDSFYDFGGDSLLSLQIIVEINKQLDLKFCASILEQYPSAYALTKYIESL